MAKLAGLKKVAPEKPVETAEVKQEVTPEVKASGLTSKLKNLKKEPVEGEVKASTSTKDSLFTEEGYVKLLSDGEFHTIRGMLDHFKLPHTSGGRERFRRANAKLTETGEYKIEANSVDGAKAFKLVKVVK